MTLMNLSYIFVILQLELWRKFSKQRRMEHKHVTGLIQIMIAIPVNTGWIKRAIASWKWFAPKEETNCWWATLGMNFSWMFFHFHSVLQQSILRKKKLLLRERSSLLISYNLFFLWFYCFLWSDITI